MVPPATRPLYYNVLAPHVSHSGPVMTDLRAQLQEGLGDSYALERELGRGVEGTA
jgi:hypothetical protein